MMALFLIAGFEQRLQEGCPVSSAVILFLVCGIIFLSTAKEGAENAGTCKSLQRRCRG